MLVCWIISFAFPYPANCTREVLLGLLHNYAKEWPGWERFPWRITRDLHHFIDDPPVNFHYLLIQHCVTAYACHVLLSAKFMNLEDVLDMLIRLRFEFVGVMRHELIRSLQSLRDMEDKDQIPDCSSIDEGQKGVGEDEIHRRRRAVMNAFAKATEGAVRILNYASQEADMEKQIAGHSLEAWARGDSMPSQKELMVEMVQLDGEMAISPQKSEVSQFARVNRPIPKLVVRGLRAQSQMRVFEEKPAGSSSETKPGPSSELKASSEQSAVNGGQVTVSGRAETRVNRAVAPRVRLNLTLDAEGLGGEGRSDDISHVDLREHLDRKIAGVGREMTDLKRENEDLKANAARVFAAAAVKVKPEYFRWILAVLGAGSVRQASTLLGKPNATFDAQLKRHAQLGGAYRKLYELVAVQRKLGVTSFERFSAEFLKHQPTEFRDENVLKDVLDGLEVLDGDNWPAVRKELMDMIKEVGV